ncbi:TetR/AcrR family transcriptional regulator [Inquilinus sp.]|uniref:TetR/AcrR family transcriptional regulator n=1 Tax=Inquilinus sp. TaxID=1932117 RepID=UPI0031D15342
MTDAETLDPPDDDAGTILGPRPGSGSGGRLRRAREAQILDAAEGVFAEAGFSGATMQGIAERASLPKANVHYYFGTKEALYRAVLSRILDLWVDAFDHLVPERDPAEALTAYIRDKMRWSRTRPLASKVFANEIIHGAPQVADYLSGKLKRTIDEKARVIEGWIAAGRMAPVDPRHLVFTLWAATQTYADFEAQIRAVLGREVMDDDVFLVASRHVTGLILRGCGLKPRGG